MNKLIAILLSISLLTGCDSIRLSMAEDSYSEAVEQGELTQQLALVDELYQYAPQQYEEAFLEKEYLLPLLQQLIDDPKNFKGLSDTDLQRAIDFSPQYEPFSLATKFLADKALIQSKIDESEANSSAEKQRLRERLVNTPKHIETYQTAINISGFPRYFLTSQYVRQLIVNSSGKKLNSYQLEAVVKGLAEIYVANAQKQTALVQLMDKGLIDKLPQDKQYQKENGDVQRLLAWLYKRQLALSFANASESNDYLQSLLNSSYGRERLDDVWIRLVEPAAKKAVMQAKKTYLSTLDLIASRIDKTADEKPRLKKVYSETLAIDKELLSLMWPPNGLDNFKESSKLARKTLKEQMKQAAQL